MIRYQGRSILIDIRNYRCVYSYVTVAMSKVKD